MAETANLDLPLLSDSQARKHITVNEALTRLDHLVMMAAISRTLATPPVSPADGNRYIVPTGASGAWAGRTSDVAIFVNGGWDFITPLTGWRAYVEDEAAEVVHAAGVWSVLTLPAAPSGAITVVEFEHQLSAGGAQSTTGQIPAGSLVLGVTARVQQAITGAAGWSLGVVEAETRYGEGLAVGAGAGIVSVTGAPLAYSSSVALRLTPEGGNFTGGRVKFNIHRLTFAAPPA
ncbi:DUF2793 domain-containing protein [Albimonas sp. CAU 1670]|uniref:DUF2793 domain-containing protein n=1 Tax=Albimonas sp. CAU 1670 TaxID=3032599 RepID=UPI0023DC9B20|nr:DUF2793 domain-containing protein [Albimonas sp. CAU 1670]MDF2232965.1 DUF2793 domain-containing protein [Albimonas sp. CAU 1670]